MDNYTKLSIEILQKNIDNLKKVRENEKSIKDEENKINIIDSELIEIKNDRERINNKLSKLNNYKKNHKKLVEFLLLVHAFIFVGGLIYFNLAEFSLNGSLLSLKESLVFSFMFQILILIGTIPGYYLCKKKFIDSDYTKEELDDTLKIIDEDIKSLTIKKEQKLTNIESLKLEMQTLLNQEQENIEEVSNILNARDNAINQNIMDIETFDNKLNNSFDEKKLKLEK